MKFPGFWFLTLEFPRDLTKIWNFQVWSCFVWNSHGRGEVKKIKISREGVGFFKKVCPQPVFFFWNSQIPETPANNLTMLKTSIKSKSPENTDFSQKNYYIIKYIQFEVFSV